jgi:hypothetical protein
VVCTLVSLFAFRPALIGPLAALALVAGAFEANLLFFGAFTAARPLRSGVRSREGRHEAECDESSKDDAHGDLPENRVLAPEATLASWHRLSMCCEPTGQYDRTLDFVEQTAKALTYFCSAKLPLAGTGGGR